MFKKISNYYKENLVSIAAALAAYNGDYTYFLSNR